MEKNINPLLKWVGGKSNILDNVLECFPNKINNYHEPFVGGGSILCGLLQKTDVNITGNIFAYDVNSALIQFYTNVQKNPKLFYKKIVPFVTKYKHLVGKDQENYYYQIRDTYNAMSNKNKSSYLGSALFLFLNKTCFRGLYRENKQGEYNVSFGHYSNPEIIDYRHLLDFSKLIQKVIFIQADYKDSITFANRRKGDFVYLDPPYFPEKKLTKSFVEYDANSFTRDDHEHLFKMCKEMKPRFVMSNSLPVKSYFSPKKYVVKIITAKRSIDPKHPEKTTKEVIICSI